MKKQGGWARARIFSGEGQGTTRERNVSRHLPDDIRSGRDCIAVVGKDSNAVDVFPPPRLILRVYPWSSDTRVAISATFQTQREGNGRVAVCGVTASYFVLSFVRLRLSPTEKLIIRNIRSIISNTEISCRGSILSGIVRLCLPL